jgi:5-methylcytosine-specific restriction endonuclease McrA
MSETLKQCLGCKNEKSLDEFGARSLSPDGKKSRCKDCISSAAKKYYQKNATQIKERMVRWRKDNPEYLKQYQLATDYDRKWNQANPEKKRKHRKDWYERNPQAVTAKRQNRRAMLKNAEGTFTPEEWLMLLDKYDYTCLRCGAKEGEMNHLNKKIKMTVDHVIPLSKNGPNRIENIQPLCLSCNSGKCDDDTDYRSIQVDAVV